MYHPVFWENIKNNIQGQFIVKMILLSRVYEIHTVPLRFTSSAISTAHVPQTFALSIQLNFIRNAEKISEILLNIICQLNPFIRLWFNGNDDEIIEIEINSFGSIARPSKQLHNIVSLLHMQARSGQKVIRNTTQHFVGHFLFFFKYKHKKRRNALLFNVTILQFNPEEIKHG